MHNDAHGEVPHSIIEVDSQIVESFLGRISNPEKALNNKLNIINDPAFRIIMVLRLKRHSYATKSFQDTNGHEIEIKKAIFAILEEYQGRLVKKDADYFLFSFTSVNPSILAALEVNSNFQKMGQLPLSIEIGLSAGIPVTERNHIFEDNIKMSEALCNVIERPIVITQTVKDLYESENLNTPISKEFIFSISHAEAKFMKSLLELLDQVWFDPEIKVVYLCQELGLSKSQLTRKLIKLTGLSPKRLLQKFKLRKSLLLLQQNQYTISEIAFKAGFNSAAYFSSCFLNTYGILPSKYKQ